ncbi:hypothetical protein HMPREF3097_02970 [Corynebacterium sp. HMSC27B11]|nr:hypothetical protein HMPREF3097_02970 [Corynebacterium sp. HMSC27B11]
MPATIHAQEAPALPHSKIDIHVADESGVLSENARQGLIDQTGNIDFPASVQKVVYVLIPGSSDNFNDDALDWAGHSMPELVPDGTGKGAAWANGALLLGVGTETRTNGVYCGNDVCQDLDIFEGPHLDASLEAMKDSFRRGNFANGLVEGAKAAADPELGVSDPYGLDSFFDSLERRLDELANEAAQQTEEEKKAELDPLLAEEKARENRNVAIGVGAVGVGAAGAGAVAWQRRRQQLTATAKEQFSELSTRYSELAHRLNELDIRAHSLCSPLANAELREQWTTIRDDFLSIDKHIDALGLTQASEDSDFYAKHKQIANAHETLESMSNAEENINLMFDLENGDRVKRERELRSIKRDVSEALFAVRNAEAIRQLKNVDAQVDPLLHALDAPDFMDRFARIVSDQAHALDLTARDMEHLDREAHREELPALGNADWRPGFAYSNWVPYYLLAAWHSADMRKSGTSSSRGTSTPNFTDFAKTSFRDGILITIANSLSEQKDPTIDEKTRKKQEKAARRRARRSSTRTSFSSGFSGGGGSSSW